MQSCPSLVVRCTRVNVVLQELSHWVNTTLLEDSYFWTRLCYWISQSVYLCRCRCCSLPPSVFSQLYRYRNDGMLASHWWRHAVFIVLELILDIISMNSCHINLQARFFLVFPIDFSNGALNMIYRHLVVMLPFHIPPKQKLCPMSYNLFITYVNKTFLMNFMT